MNSPLDRFDSNIVEANAPCANCGAEVAVGDALYDERAEHYFCSRRCYYEWADDNFEKVADYYYERNIE